MWLQSCKQLKHAAKGCDSLNVQQDLIALQKRGPPDMMSASVGEGGVMESRCSKGGRVNFLICISSKCGQEGRGSKKNNMLMDIIIGSPQRTFFLGYADHPGKGARECTQPCWCRFPAPLHSSRHCILLFAARSPHVSTHVRKQSCAVHNLRCGNALTHYTSRGGVGRRRQGFRALVRK